MSTVKFSDGNTKMGKIPSVSLPAIKVDINQDFFLFMYGIVSGAKCVNRV